MRYHVVRRETAGRSPASRRKGNQAETEGNGRRERGDIDTRFFGTLRYAPPEQYGFAQTDARADIYSFGILLRFLLPDRFARV